MVCSYCGKDSTLYPVKNNTEAVTTEILVCGECYFDVYGENPEYQELSVQQLETKKELDNPMIYQAQETEKTK